MQHGYWDNTRACSHHRRRFGHRRTCLKNAKRNAKRKAEKDHQEVLVASVGRRGAGEDESQPTQEPMCRPNVAHPASTGLRSSQFVRIWPLYPDAAFVPFLSKW